MGRHHTLFMPHLSLLPPGNRAKQTQGRDLIFCQYINKFTENTIYMRESLRSGLLLCKQEHDACSIQTSSFMRCRLISEENIENMSSICREELFRCHQVTMELPGDNERNAAEVLKIPQEHSADEQTHPCVCPQ